MAFVLKEGMELIEATVRFLTSIEGGRQTPILNTAGHFRPHATIEGSYLRHAVFFVGGPEILKLGDVHTVQMLLPWYPDDPYDEFVPGAKVGIWEGPHLVANASISRRWHHHS